MQYAEKASNDGEINCNRKQRQGMLDATIIITCITSLHLYCCMYSLHFVPTLFGISICMSFTILINIFTFVEVLLLMLFIIYYLDKDRSIDIVAMSCVFSGAPRAGKTTVVKRLKGHHVDINIPLASTGIIDEKGVCRIDFVPSSSIVTDQEWVEMEEDDEVQAFLNLTIIPQRKSDEELVLTENKSDESKEEKETENRRGIDSELETENERGIEQERKKNKSGLETENERDISMKEPETKNERGIMQKSKKTDVSKEEPDTENKRSKMQDSTKIDVLSKEEPDTENERSKVQDSKRIDISKEESQERKKNDELETENEKGIEHKSKKSDKDSELPTPMSVLAGALLHSKQIRACRRLSKRHFLLLTDTGGQPEFRKLIPVLIPGPSNTYIVFRLCDEFDSTLPVRFCCHNGKEIEYGRTFSLREMINDILQNMHCSKVKGLLMFIGTHKDKIPESERNIFIDQKNHELLEILKQCPYYNEDVVMKSDDHRIIFCVDNTTFENEHKCIRSRVLELCQTARFQVKIKPEYLLLALTLKGTKRVILSFDECVKVAEKCGIKEEKDVQEALATLHEKLLMIRVYEMNDDKIVVNKPKVLINKVSRTLKHMIERNSQESRSNLISYSELQNIAASGEAMETKVFKEILLHLSIIAPLTKENEGITEYIVPCMGPQIKLEPLSERWIKPNQHFFTFKLSVPSKPFQFSVPSTLTSLILCSLLQNEQYTAKLSSSKVGITLSKDNLTVVIEIFQDCVSLHFENMSEEMLPMYRIMEVVRSALNRCIKLVGYEVPNAMKCILCPSCTNEIQFAEIHGDMADCLNCHMKTVIHEDNIIRGEFSLHKTLQIAE